MVADKDIGECKGEDWDVIALPGGMPGAERLRDNKVLEEMLKEKTNNSVGTVTKIVVVSCDFTSQLYRDYNEPFARILINQSIISIMECHKGFDHCSCCVVEGYTNWYPMDCASMFSSNPGDRIINPVVVSLQQYVPALLWFLLIMASFSCSATRPPPHPQVHFSPWGPFFALESWCLVCCLKGKGARIYFKSGFEPNMAPTT